MEGIASTEREKSCMEIVAKQNWVRKVLAMHGGKYPCLFFILCCILDIISNGRYSILINIAGPNCSSIIEYSIAIPILTMFCT
jgi:hypothetical protein